MDTKEMLNKKILNKKRKIDDNVEFVYCTDCQKTYFLSNLKRRRLKSAGGIHFRRGKR